MKHLRLALVCALMLSGCGGDAPQAEKPPDGPMATVRVVYQGWSPTVYEIKYAGKTYIAMYECGIAKIED